MDFIWTDKVDNSDYVVADDINYVANSVSTINNTLNEHVKTYDSFSMTVNERINGLANGYSSLYSDVEKKASTDLSNVEDSVFLAKINAVLADGDEVSY